MMTRPAHTQRFKIFEETLVSVHGHFHMFVMLRCCRRTQRHAGAGKIIEHGQNFFLGPMFEQKRRKPFTEHDINAMITHAFGVRL